MPGLGELSERAVRVRERLQHLHHARRVGPERVLAERQGALRELERLPRTAARIEENRELRERGEVMALQRSAVRGLGEPDGLARGGLAAREVVEALEDLAEQHIARHELPDSRLQPLLDGELRLDMPLRLLKV